MDRAIGVKELLSCEFPKMGFDGRWKESFGDPAPFGLWMVWGHPKNGKTTFCLQMAKYLCGFVKHKVAYNSIEEGKSPTFKDAIERANMIETGNKFMILNREPINELTDRLRKRRSPDVVFIDSLQRAELGYRQVTEMREEFADKLLILVSHAEGNQPATRQARSLVYDCDLVINVKAFEAYPTGRYGGGEKFVISEEMKMKFV